MLRLEGQRYRARLEHVSEPELHDALARSAAEKYGFDVPERADPDAVWFFAVRARAAGDAD